MAVNFKFNSKEGYQLDAINSVVDLFEGQRDKGNQLNIFHTDEDALFSESGAIGNVLTLADSEVLHNLRNIQDNNGLELSETLDGFDFDVEMETGTGKTYVYLRTAFELAKKYGFLKYMILVPSIAIKEGVLKSLELMKPHFTSLYPDQPFDTTVFSGKTPEVVRSFATTNTLQFMIVTIDSLKGTGDNRIMRRESNKLGGLRPIDYLEATNPILIMDEPQNMESKLSHDAVSDLNPSFVLRYSATHKTTRNIVYRLDPVDAHDLGIVKQIVVAEAKENTTASKPFIKLLDVRNKKRFEAYLELAYPTSRKKVWVPLNTRLSKLTGNKTYGNSRISEINLDPAFMDVTGVGVLHVGDEVGGAQTSVFKEMIRETVKEHCSREARLRNDGVKVLTLFFVDKVASFLGGGSNNFDANGDFVKWFDEAYLQERSKYGDMLPESPQGVRKAYFAQMRKGKGTSAVETFIDTTGNSQKDDDAYELIMKDKEELLDMNNPVRFIFSHSALREGWDNPNVFQICLLRSMSGEIERRQTIGRGLRLPVNQNGEQIKNRSINQLTVIANESYKEFAKGLQTEYEKAGVSIGIIREGEFSKLFDSDGTKIGFDESKNIWNMLQEANIIDSGGKITQQISDTTVINLPEEYKNIESEILEILKSRTIGNMVKNDRDRVKRTFNETLCGSEMFEAFWDTISAKTTYKVNASKEKMVEESSEAINNYDYVDSSEIEIIRANVTVERGGVEGEEIGRKSIDTNSETLKAPDIMELVAGSTPLTRNTLIDIIATDESIQDSITTQDQYEKAAIDLVNSSVNSTSVNSVEYEKISGQIYDLEDFITSSRSDKDHFKDKLYEVKNTQKTDFNHIVCDSEIEKQFAQKLDNDENVVMFMKLPSEFKIPTPVGYYNPDWAIIKNVDGELIYEIRETKGTDDNNFIRTSELNKIRSARKHFKTIGVSYGKSTPNNWNI